MANIPVQLPFYVGERPVPARKPSRPLPIDQLVAVGETATHPHYPAHDAQHNSQRNGSTASSTSSPVDSACSPRRSSSVASHQQFGSLPVRKTRSGSIVLPSIPQNQSSPQKQHRLSRSISASVEPVAFDTHNRKELDEKDNFKPLQRRPTEPLPGPPPTPSLHSARTGQRPTGLRMISTSFRADMNRRQSEAQGLGMTSYPSATLPPVPNTGGHSPVATYNHIQETANKRMATLDYLRKVHEGQVYYFSTVSYSAANLSSLPSLHPSKLGRRATNYLLLGTSMTPLLEFYASSPLDYLRALASLLLEFDTYCQLSTSEHGHMSFTKNRMAGMLKSGMRGVKSRRSSAATDSLLSDQMSSNSSSTNVSGLASIADSMPLPPLSSSTHDFQYLQSPTLPFDPDFGTSFATLIEILVEAYRGLLTLLPSPEACVPGVAEAFAKTDKQMRKVMLGGIVNEFGESTRNQARTEVGGLGKLVLSGLM